MREQILELMGEQILEQDSRKTVFSILCVLFVCHELICICLLIYKRKRKRESTEKGRERGRADLLSLNRHFIEPRPEATPEVTLTPMP